MLTRCRFKTASPKIRAAILMLVALFAAPHAFAQGEAPATVTGRVTDGDKGIAGIVVGPVSLETATRSRTTARAKTDGEGRYRLTNVPPGRYQIMPYAPAYIVRGLDDDSPPGKALTLAAGDEVADIDFRLERGGVITGRVTDAEGNPVIAEQVTVIFADSKQFHQRRFIDPRDTSTDDRGIYRIYGLPPGRYRVSVGQSGERGTVSYGRRKLYRQTFYPDVTEEAQARIVEVTAGNEASDIDITLGRAIKTYRASGRFVSAETGEPVPNLPVGIGPLDPATRRFTSFGGSAMANARGEFQTEALSPGRYAVFALPQGQSDWYSDTPQFEITDADVTGLVVKLRRGATASGIVTIEGVRDRALAARLVRSVRIYWQIDTRGDVTLPGFAPPIIAEADGTFRLTGLRPGKLRINISGGEKGVSMSRIELNGSNAIGGIDIADGAQISGLHIVLAYSNGIVRGQINVLNGTLSPVARLFAFIRRISDDGAQGWRSSEVDTRGRFVLEGLAPGEYDLHVQGQVPNAQQRYQSDHQNVSIGENSDINVTLALDLSGPLNRGGRP